MSDLPLSFRQPAKVPPVETPGLTGLLTLAVGVVVVAALYFGREVLIPITLAVLLSFLVAPIVNLLNRLRVGRVPSVLLAVVLALGLILSLGGLIGIQVADLAGQIPRYQSTVENKINTVRSLTIGRMSRVIDDMTKQLAVARPARGGPSAGAPGAAAGNSAPAVPVEVQQPGPTPMDLAAQVLAPVLGPLSTTAIVFIFATFILLQRQDLRDRLIRLFGSEDLHRTTLAMDDAARRLSKYFLTQLGINAGFGCIIGIGLTVIGVPSPLLWGILATLLRFLPYIGAPLAAILPLALAAAVDPGWSTMIWTGALYLLSEAVTGQVIEPMLYGHSTGLSPLSVMVAATFWTWLWGPIGLILSTPLTLCLLVLGRHVKRLEFLDVLLGDRPALTPVESFYQRLLAGDPDEALDQAELLLKDRSLSSYYDEVAVRGLQLAANDALRGVLTEAHLQRIRAAIKALVDDLEGHEDREPSPREADDAAVVRPAAEQALPQRPAPRGRLPEPEALAPQWRSAAPVMCIAGRGPLDEAASMILAQVLGKYGLGASVVSHEMVARGAIATLDMRGVAMVCIACLEIAGATSHLRYLLRRIRQHMPDALVLVVLWPVDGAQIEDRLRAAVAADVYATSLHDAVEGCLQAARAASDQPAEAQPARHAAAQ
jgi:predicted PurR-regulated permease PerM